MKNQCGICGKLVSVNEVICEDCIQELLNEEEQRSLLARENYDYDYGDYRY